MEERTTAMIMLDDLRSHLRQFGQLDLSLRVHAGAKRTAVKELMDDGSLKIEVSAPPDDGKANDAVIDLLSKEFAVPPNHIELLTGLTSRLKRIRITR